MFNLIVTHNPTAWETDQLMRIEKDRFGEYSGHEAETIQIAAPETLGVLENCPTLLMYEMGSEAVNRDMIRYGQARNIVVSRKDIVFRFEQEGIFSRAIMQEFGDRLDIDSFEWNRTHWAIKDGGIPSAMLDRLKPSNDVIPKMVTLFISHASEDKDAFVRPLAEALKSAGYGVWFDEYELTLGDSLLGKIDEGLKKADYGVVVLSKSFFAKDWPKRELDGLIALEKENKKLILPIWLGVTKDEVSKFSPILAGLLGGKGDRGVPYILDEIQKAISVSGRTREVAAPEGMRSKLQSINKKLSTRENELRRINSIAGVNEVMKAVAQIADAIAGEVEQVNQGEQRKRFTVVAKGAPGTIAVRGPAAVYISTRVTRLAMNRAGDAEFIVKISQGSSEVPPTTEPEILEEMTFKPRMIDDQEIQWDQEDGINEMMSSVGVAERIIERFVQYIDDLTDD
jgi:hypothetical protein